MHFNHSRNSVAAKARKRMASPPPEYFTAPTDQPDYQIVSRNCRTGETHVFTLVISPRRINQFRVFLDGSFWREMGKSRLLAGLRKALPTYAKIP